MDDQERNHEALIDRFAEQARIIRHRNDRIAEVEARANELALELAHAVTRAEKAERERDEWKDSAIKAMADLERAEQPRPLPADDITDEARERAYRAVAALSVSDWDDMSGVAKGRAMALAEAVITEITRPEPPTRPEGAEKVEAVLHQYWSGDINGDDLADRIVEEMNR